MPADSTPRSILLLRALSLGDLLCAVPALRSLRAGLPKARVALLGLPWAREFQARFSHLLDEFIEFPGYPGLTEGACTPEAWHRFVGAMRNRHFDLVLQMHGSGELSNQVARQFGARVVVGLARENPPADGTFGPWVEGLPEVEQCLRLTDLLGLRRTDHHLEFPRTAADAAEFEGLATRFSLPPQGYVVVHPGAKLPSRRWSAQRFGELASRLARCGYRVVITGAAAEAGIAEQVVSAAPEADAVDLTGLTTLGGYAEVLSRGRLVICNDTSASHMAAAVRTPSVVVSCGSDVGRWAPSDSERHRVISLQPGCRPCAHFFCPYNHECADIDVGQVERTALEQLARTEPARLTTPVSWP